jgi:hypothetical protein
MDLSALVETKSVCLPDESEADREKRQLLKRWEDEIRSKTTGSMIHREESQPEQDKQAAANQKPPGG